MSIDAASKPREESIGSQLNRMSGVQTEKNLYEPKDKMGKETFLKMFTAQLRNQDPLNPVKNEDFSQQMAMFSQLEQQMNTNKNLEKMIENQSNTQLAALQLVGKTIVADRATIYHEKDKFSALNFKLPVDTMETKVEVLDVNGDTLKSIQLGGQAQGDVQTKWDGTAEDGRPMASGKYTYKIVAKGMDGKPVEVATRVDGKVNGVTTAKGAVFLLVGDQKIGLNDVETIKETPNATPPAVGGAPGPARPAGAAGLPPEVANALAAAVGNPAGMKIESPDEKTETRGNADDNGASRAAAKPHAMEIEIGGEDASHPSIEDVAGSIPSGDRVDRMWPYFPM